MEYWIIFIAPVESNELVEQTAEVESTTKGSVSSFSVVSPGIGYTVGEGVIFGNTLVAGSWINKAIYNGVEETVIMSLYSDGEISFMLLLSEI